MYDRSCKRASALARKPPLYCDLKTSSTTPVMSLIIDYFTGKQVWQVLQVTAETLKIWIHCDLDSNHCSNDLQLGRK